jgi:signal transduction histidine kinase
MGSDGHNWRGKASASRLMLPAFEAMTHGILLVMPHRKGTRIRSANSGLGRILGIDHRALVGEPEEAFWDPLLARLGNPHSFRQDLIRIQGNPHEIRSDVLHLVAPTPLVVERTSSPLADSEGNYLGRIWTFRNASREFRLREELQKRRKTEYCFRSLSSHLFEAALSAESLREICRISCIGLDVASVVYAPLQSTQFELAQFCVSRALEIGDGTASFLRFVGKSLRRAELGSTTILQTGDVSLPARKLLEAREVRRILLVPVGFDDAVFGGLVLEETTGDHEWAREDLKCVESVARAMGLWLHKEANEKHLVRAREETSAAARARTDFIALLSHELRTPLNPLIGFTQLLEEQRDEMPEEAADMVSHIAAGAMRLRELVEDLLTLTRLDARLDGWRRYHCDPRGILDDSCTWARRFSREKNITVELDIDGELGVVEADGAALRRAVNAMLSNAIRFTAHGGNVKLCASSNDVVLHLRICDQGPGVADEAKERIFEPFIQGEPVLTRRHGGAGIGLTLVRKVADSHEGLAWVDDAPGGGSIFHLELPVAILDDEDQ